MVARLLRPVPRVLVPQIMAVQPLAGFTRRRIRDCPVPRPFSAPYYCTGLFLHTGLGKQAIVLVPFLARVRQRRDHPRRVDSAGVASSTGDAMRQVST